MAESQFVQINGVAIEVPRLLKKPGEHKAVHTEAELRAALAEGWVLRLTEPVDVAVDADLVAQDVSADATPVEPPPAPSADAVDEPDLASALTADLERQEDEAKTTKQRSTSHAAHGGAKKK